MSGVNVATIDEYGFSGLDGKIIGIDLEHRLAVYAVEYFGFFMPVAVDNVLAGAITVPVGSKWKMLTTVRFAFFQRAAECLIHESHLINIVL